MVVFETIFEYDTEMEFRLVAFRNQFRIPQFRGNLFVHVLLCEVSASLK